MDDLFSKFTWIWYFLWNVLCYHFCQQFHILRQTVKTLIRSGLHWTQICIATIVIHTFTQVVKDNCRLIGWWSLTNWSLKTVGVQQQFNNKCSCVSIAPHRFDDLLIIRGMFLDQSSSAQCHIFLWFRSFVDQLKKKSACC